MSITPTSTVASRARRRRSTHIPVTPPTQSNAFAMTIIVAYMFVLVPFAILRTLIRTAGTRAGQAVVAFRMKRSVSAGPRPSTSVEGNAAP